MNTKDLTPYEETVVLEIADHIVNPNAIQTILSVAGKPFAFALEKARNIKGLRLLPQIVDTGVQKGLRTTIKIATKISSEESIVSEFANVGVRTSFAEVPNQDLKKKDDVADTFDVSNAIIVGAEGFAMGIAATVCEAFPGAQPFVPAVVAADISASMVFLSRHATQIAASYGYSARDPRSIPHIIAAMAPQTSSSDEGYLAAKVAVLEMNQAAARFASDYAGRNLQNALTKGEIPTLVKLINYVAERLGVVITQKELGMLVPMAGALLNGSVNVAFQQVGHTAAKDYFRRLHLVSQYGEERTDDLIARAVEELRRRAA